jgi:Helix-turn-helix
VSSPGAAGRVAAIEDQLRLAAGLTALREEAGLSQRELAKRIGVSQPRVAAEGSDGGCAAAGLDTVQHGAPGRAQLLEGAQTGRSRAPDRASPTLSATRSATRFDLATTASKRKTQHDGFD